MATETVFTVEATPFKFGAGRSRRRGLGAQAPRRQAAAGGHRRAHRRARRRSSRSSRRIIEGARRLRPLARRADASTRCRTPRTSRSSTRSTASSPIGGGSTHRHRQGRQPDPHPPRAGDGLRQRAGRRRAASRRRRSSRTSPSRRRPARGSEATTVAVLDLPDLGVKSGISHRYLRATQAIVDPELTRTLPPEVTGSCGLDVVCHAAESFLSKPFDTRDGAGRPRPTGRPTRAPTRWRTSGRRRRSSTAAATCARAVAGRRRRRAAT